MHCEVVSWATLCLGYILIELHPEWVSQPYIITAYAMLAHVGATVQQQYHTAFPCITQHNLGCCSSLEGQPPSGIWGGGGEGGVETVPTAVHWPMLMSQYLRAWKNLLTNSESVPSIILNSFFVPAPACHIEQLCSHTAHVVCRSSKLPACRRCLTSALLFMCKLVCKDSRH